MAYNPVGDPNTRRVTHKIYWDWGREKPRPYNGCGVIFDGPKTSSNEWSTVNCRACLKRKPEILKRIGV